MKRRIPAFLPSTSLALSCCVACLGVLTLLLVTGCSQREVVRSPRVIETVSVESPKPGDTKPPTSDQAKSADEVRSTDEVEPGVVAQASDVDESELSDVDLSAVPIRPPYPPSWEVETTEPDERVQVTVYDDWDKVPEETTIEEYRYLDVPPPEPLDPEAVTVYRYRPVTYEVVDVWEWDDPYYQDWDHNYWSVSVHSGHEPWWYRSRHSWVYDRDYRPWARNHYDPWDYGWDGYDEGFSVGYHYGYEDGYYESYHTSVSYYSVAYYHEDYFPVVWWWGSYQHRHDGHRNDRDDDKDKKDNDDRDNKDKNAIAKRSVRDAKPSETANMKPRRKVSTQPDDAGAVVKTDRTTRDAKPSGNAGTATRPTRQAPVSSVASAAAKNRRDTGTVGGSGTLPASSGTAVRERNTSDGPGTVEKSSRRTFPTSTGSDRGDRTVRDTKTVRKSTEQDPPKRSVSTTEFRGERGVYSVPKPTGDARRDRTIAVIGGGDNASGEGIYRAPEPSKESLRDRRIIMIGGNRGNSSNTPGNQPPSVEGYPAERTTAREARREPVSAPQNTDRNAQPSGERNRVAPPADAVADTSSDRNVRDERPTSPLPEVDPPGEPRQVAPRTASVQSPPSRRTEPQVIRSSSSAPPRPSTPPSVSLESPGSTSRSRVSRDSRESGPRSSDTPSDRSTRRRSR